MRVVGALMWDVASLMVDVPGNDIQNKFNKGDFLVVERFGQEFGGVCARGNQKAHAFFDARNSVVRTVLRKWVVLFTCPSASGMVGEEMFVYP